MKKFKHILCGVLLFALMVGFVFPIMQMPALANDYTLTVLNPMGPIVPRNNMPLADRQPLLDKLEACGAQGPVDILLLHYEKSDDQLQVWALGLMLKDYWEAEYPGTTVRLTPTDPAGGPMVWGVRPDSWDWAEQGRVPWLGSPWGPKTGYNFIDGMPYSEEPFARYQYWANNFDFVLFGEQN